MEGEAIALRGGAIARAGIVTDTALRERNAANG
jgi:hypothetical protein